MIGSFPERVRLARTKRGLSQLALSKAVGLSDAYVAQIEAGGIKRPGYDAAVKLAKVLDVPLEWIADGEGDEPDWGPPSTERTAS